MRSGDGGPSPTGEPSSTGKRKISRKAARKAAARAEAERRDAAASEARGGRNCYCEPGDEYCGTCRVCGAPGHTRHFPGSVPYTGSWCDRHYRRLAWTHPRGTYGCWLWVGLAVLAFLALRVWLAS